MSVWLCIPSARPVDQVNARMDKWRAMGYKIALWRDDLYVGEGGYVISSLDICRALVRCDKLFVARDYPGYASAVNTMSRTVLRDDPECDWIVCAGDDTDPDNNLHANTIAAQCSVKFGIASIAKTGKPPFVSTFGVMQPTGDRWADGKGVIIERIAGSPWLGREWCQRANAGKGPLWPEFSHMFVDEHLQVYAQSLGVFLQRPDLIHFHDHAQRDGVSAAPPHMAKWNTQQHWIESKAIFERLKKGNFAECAPLPKNS